MFYDLLERVSNLEEKVSNLENESKRAKLNSSKMIIKTHGSPDFEIEFPSPEFFKGS